MDEALCCSLYKIHKHPFLSYNPNESNTAMYPFKKCHYVSRPYRTEVSSLSTHAQNRFVLQFNPGITSVCLTDQAIIRHALRSESVSVHNEGISVVHWWSVAASACVVITRVYPSRAPGHVTRVQNKSLYSSLKTCLKRKRKVSTNTLKKRRVENNLIMHHRGLLFRGKCSVTSSEWLVAVVLWGPAGLRRAYGRKVEQQRDVACGTCFGDVICLWIRLSNEGEQFAHDPQPAREMDFS